MRVLPLLGGLALAAGCGPADPEFTELRQGLWRARVESRAHHTDLLRTTLHFAADAPPALRGGHRPALIFVQGGRVAVDDYAWLAERLATRGYLVAMPEHPLELAITAADDAAYVRELLAAPPPGSWLEGAVDRGRIAVGGHSLGGVVALKNALGEGFAAVALFASYPDPADAARVPGLGLPSLSVAGREDCSAALGEVATGASSLPSPTALVVLDGVTHYQFTGSDALDRERDCAPPLALADAHDRIEAATHAFLDAALDGRGTGAAELALIPGAEVTAR